MRLLLIAAVLALGACARDASAPTASGCALEATQQVTWSTEGAPDTITTRSEGPSCTQTVVSFVMRNADGDPLWVFASTFYDLTAGGIPPEGAPATTEADVQTFLASWADVTEMRSGELPAWTEAMSRPGEGVEALGYESPFDRETYEVLRQRNLPTICYAAAVAAAQCLIMDPASHAATMIVAYGS